ncbi:unnamed protein product [Phaedon cochleariae]|uniref:Coiled-coil domain-containing protein 22 homolog n=1 Tax=Phaedon cochleariae TaxID=80249 RepID=A0A9P0DJ66_PHACE|nr:unnamed protein product [Phaedon cochleariae]
MEEVDRIIIDSLRNLDCNLGDETQNLKQFDADLVVLSVSTCLEAISPNTVFPKKLPSSMSARLKLASNLAEYIKDLGFRGDMGYQTILYCNEVEVRKVLMFLIERIPRETHKSIPIEQTGYVPRLVRTIEENIKNSMRQMWIPSCYIRRGIREIDGGYIVNSMSSSCPLQSINLVIPDSKCQNEVLKQYWVHTVPDVTEQCSSRNLVPSLLFNDLEFPQNSSLLKLLNKQSQTQVIDNIDTEMMISLSPKIMDNSNQEVNNKETDGVVENKTMENKIEKLSVALEENKAEYLALQEDIKNDELQLSQTSFTKNEVQTMLNNILAKVKLKRKTQAIINKKENKVKLQNMIQTAKDRLVELANQWNNVQTPLLEEYDMLQSTLSIVETKIQDEKRKLDTVKDMHAKLHEDLKQKTVLEQTLLEKCQKMNKTNNRSAYTRRILEIIGNIRKQNHEIQKVLRDTREIQKEINNLSGQVDRSFTLSDELIFFDAKHDEMARRAYKLLAALRDECNNILKAVTDMGVVERESRNIQEQIETEKAKEVGLKLDRVYSDLALIQKETQNLLKQSNNV